MRKGFVKRKYDNGQIPFVFDRSTRVGEHWLQILTRYGVKHYSVPGGLNVELSSFNGRSTMKLSASLINAKGEKLEMEWMFDETTASTDDMFNSAISDFILLSDLAAGAGMSLAKGWVDGKGAAKAKAQAQDFLPAPCPKCKCGGAIWLDQFTSNAGKKMRSVKCVNYKFGSPDAKDHFQKLVNEDDEYVMVDRYNNVGKKIAPVTMPLPPMGKTYADIKAEDTDGDDDKEPF